MKRRYEEILKVVPVPVLKRVTFTLCRCMGHNRGWEEAASALCGVSVELKTANAALLEAPGGSWQEVHKFISK